MFLMKRATWRVVSASLFRYNIFERWKGWGLRRWAGEEELQQYLRGRCAVWPVKAPSSEHMWFSRGCWRCHYRLHVSQLSESPSTFSHTCTIHLAAVWLNLSDGSQHCCVCIWVNVCVSLWSAEAAATPPAGALRGFEAQSKSPLRCLVGLNPTVIIKTRSEHLKENVQSHPVFLLSFFEGA